MSVVTQASGVTADLTRLAGPVWFPGEPQYDEHLRTWNARSCSAARVVACPSSVDDVSHAVRAVADVGWDLAVRGGGHHVAGSAVATDGLVLDMRALRRVRPLGERLLRVGAGANWEDVAVAAHALGGSVPAGNTPSTGVVGVALGGGIGLFSRAWGLTCDRIRAVGLVDAWGTYRRIDAHRDPELFRVARGAGRGIGVVTDLDVEVCPYGPEVATVQVHHPLSSAGDVLRGWLDAAVRSSREVGAQITVQRLPDAGSLDARLRGRWVVSVGAVYAGEPVDGETVLTPFARLGEVLADQSGAASVVEGARPWRPGVRAHSCSHFLQGMDDTAVREVLSLFGTCPTGASVTLRWMGGAVHDVPEEESAFPHRGARLLATAQVEWHDPADDDVALAWCRAADLVLARAGTSGVYGNFVPTVKDFGSLRKQAYGDVNRIDRVLRSHDPEGRFRSMAMRP